MGGLRPLIPEGLTSAVLYVACGLFLLGLAIHIAAAWAIGVQRKRPSDGAPRNFIIPSKDLNRWWRLMKLPQLIVVVAMQLLAWIFWLPLFGFPYTNGRITSAVACLLVLVPIFMLLATLLQDAISAIRMIKPPRTHVVRVLGLTAASISLALLSTGLLSDVVLFLSAVPISTSAFTAIWFPLLPLILLSALLFWLLFSLLNLCVKRPTSPAARIKRALQRVLEPEGVPPMVDLVSHRKHLTWFARATFLYPFVIVSAFALAGSALVDPVLSEHGHAVALEQVCEGPLTTRLQTLSATGLFWLLNLLGGSAGRGLSNSLTGVSLPSSPTPSLAELYELSAGVQRGKVSSIMMQMGWNSAFEPLGEACGHGGKAIVGAVRPQHPLVRRGECYDCVRLPPLRVAVMRHGGEPCLSCIEVVGLSVHSTPAEGCEPARVLYNGSVHANGAGIATFRGVELGAYPSASARLCEGVYTLEYKLPNKASIRTLLRLSAFNSNRSAVSTTSSVQSTWDASRTILTSMNTTISKTEEDHTLLTTTIVQTTQTVYDQNGVELTSVDHLQKTRETRASSHAMVWVTPPPTLVEFNTPFRVTLLIVSEMGQPVPAEAVQAVLISPASSGIILDTSSDHVTITDSQGRATFNLTITHSADQTREGNVTLLFGSRHTSSIDTSATFNAITAALSKLVAPTANIIGSPLPPPSPPPPSKLHEATRLAASAVLKAQLHQCSGAAACTPHHHASHVLLSALSGEGGRGPSSATSSIGNAAVDVRSTMSSSLLAWDDMVRSDGGKGARALLSSGGTAQAVGSFFDSVFRASLDAQSALANGGLATCVQAADVVQVVMGEVMRRGGGVEGAWLDDLIVQLLSSAALNASISDALRGPLLTLASASPVKQSSHLVGQALNSFASSVARSLAGLGEARRRRSSEAVEARSGVVERGELVALTTAAQNASRVLNQTYKALAPSVSSTGFDASQLLTRLLRDPSGEGPLVLRQLYSLFLSLPSSLLSNLLSLLTSLPGAASSGTTHAGHATWVPVWNNSESSNITDDVQNDLSRANASAFVRQVMKEAGGGVGGGGGGGGEMPSSSSLRVTSAPMLVLTPHSLCYGAAASLSLLSTLLTQQLPSMDEMLDLLKKAVAFGLAVAADNGAPLLAEALSLSFLSSLFPEFSRIWAHITSLREQLAAEAEKGFQAANFSDTPSSSPPPPASPSATPSVRGRSAYLLHKRRRVQPVLAESEMEVPREAGEAGKAIGEGEVREDGNAKTNHLSTDGALSPPSEVSLDWLGRFASDFLSRMGGVSVPTATQIRVTYVELSAPLVGHGAMQPGRVSSSWSAFSTQPDTPSSPSRVLRSCADLGYMHYEAAPSDSTHGLWQQISMVPYNWLFDSGLYADGSERKWCPYESSSGGAVGYDETDSERWGRWGLQRLSFEEQSDNATLGALETTSTPAQRSRAIYQAAQLCPTDPVAGMRTEISTLCRESYTASGQLLPFTAGRSASPSTSPSSHAPPLSNSSAVPMVRVSDQYGSPMAGKNCTVELEGGRSWWAFSPPVVSYECGPSDEEGWAEIRRVSVDGGPSGRIRLVVKVEGVVSRPWASSPWRFDSQLLYVSTQQPAFGKVVGLLFGHTGSIHLLLLLSLLMLSLNAISMRYNAVERAPVVMRFLGYFAMLWLVELNSSLFIRTFHFSSTSSPSTAAHLSMISTFEIFATRTGHVSFAQSTLVFLTGLLSLTILISQSRLFWFSFRRPLTSASLYLKGELRTSPLGPLFRHSSRQLTRVRDASLKASQKPGRCLSLMLATASSLCSRTVQFCHGVHPAYDGAMEARVKGESHAEMRQRCARNYVRKLLRGRGWVRLQLFKEQEDINSHSLMGYTRELLFGIPRRVSMHRPFETVDDFAYPERMWFAFLLSLWIQVMIAIVLVYAAINLSALYAHLLTLSAEAKGMADFGKLSSTDRVHSKYEGSSLLFMLGCSAAYDAAAYFLGIDLNVHETFGISQFVQTERAIMVPLAVCLACLSTLHFLCLWVAFFRRYRSRIFAMRQGVYFYNRRAFTEQVGSNFIGYQCAFMLANSLVFMLLFLLVVFFGVCTVMGLLSISSSGGRHTDGRAWVANHSSLLLLEVASNASSPEPSETHTWLVPPSVQEYSSRLAAMTSPSKSLPSFLWWLLCPIVGQYLLNRFIFFTRPTRFRDGRRGNSWLRYRFIYAIYEYMLILPNLGVGFVFVLLRLILSPVLMGYYLFAMDVNLFPGASRVEAWEPAFASYVAMAAQDHRYNNPILLVFIGLMQEALHELRLDGARKKFKREIRRRLVERAALNSKKAPSPWLRGFLGGCTAPPPPDHASDEIDELEIESGQAWGQHSQQDKADEVAEGRRKRRLILNRWQLARVLLFNGSLIKYRKHNLTVSGIHQKELSELVEAMRQRFGSDMAGLELSLSHTKQLLGEAVIAGSIPLRAVTDTTVQALKSAGQKGGEIWKSGSKSLGDTTAAALKTAVNQFGEKREKTSEALEAPSNAQSPTHGAEGWRGFWHIKETSVGVKQM